MKFIRELHCKNMSPSDDRDRMRKLWEYFIAINLRKYHENGISFSKMNYNHCTARSCYLWMKCANKKTIERITMTNCRLSTHIIDFLTKLPNLRVFEFEDLGRRRSRYSPEGVAKIVSFIESLSKNETLNANANATNIQTQLTQTTSNCSYDLSTTTNRNKTKNNSAEVLESTNFKKTSTFAGVRILKLLFGLGGDVSLFTMEYYFFGYIMSLNQFYSNLQSLHVSIDDLNECTNIFKNSKNSLYSNSNNSNPLFNKLEEICWVLTKGNHKMLETIVEKQGESKLKRLNIIVKWKFDFDKHIRDKLVRMLRSLVK